MSDFKSVCACRECEPYASIHGCLKRHALLRGKFNSVKFQHSMFLWTFFWQGGILIHIYNVKGSSNRMKGTLKETTLILEHHRNSIILSEGTLSETTQKYEMLICFKRVNRMKGDLNESTLIFCIKWNPSIDSECMT